jgi:regulation of enolase protein 1 (concanavalin A-like superfamily)
MREDMTRDDPDSVGFDAVPFALEWLRRPAAWVAEPARLVVSAPAQTDWFIDPISARSVRTAPVLVGAAPSSDFTWEAHVVLDGDAMFDAAGLFFYDDDDHWAKLAVEVTAAGPTIVSVVTDTLSDDCNSTVLGQSSAWLRLARVGEAIAFHTSDGGERWELVRVFRPPSAAQRVGFVCQAPTGAGCTGTFEAIAFNARSLSDIRDGS